MYVVLDSEVNLEAVKYTFKLLLEDFLGLEFEFLSLSDDIPANKLTIYYGSKKNCKADYNLKIFRSDFWLIENYLKNHSLPKLPLPRFQEQFLPEIIDNKELPVIYMSSNPKKAAPYIKFIDEKNQETNIDFIASSFFMVSRYEELVNLDRDEHDRFAAQDSIALQDNFLHRPIVNEYLEIIWYLLKKIDSTLVRAQRKFELFLTHDIDNLKLWTVKKRIRYLGSLLIKRRSIKEFFKYMKRTFRFIFLSRKNSFDYINFTSKKFSFKSHFYFLVNGTARYDNRFDINSKKALKIIKKIEAQNHSVGLHPSYSSYLDDKQLLKEKTLLDNIVANKNYGVRGHYLRFKVPDTFRMFEACGFTHDATLGYSHHYGYRAGVCYPYKPFDIENDREINIVENPLIAMDVTFTGRNSLNLEKKERHELLKKIIDKVSFFNGVFVFLVHNTAFEDLEFEWRKIYEDLLSYCQEKMK